MKTTYSFLKDELALIEIRKHKWIESEKLGKEIGFATAAYDWINKYGYTWKQFRLDVEDNKNVFTERRQYRRFLVNFPIQLKTDQLFLASYTNDFSFIGFGCTIPVHIPQNTPTEIAINFNEEGTAAKKSRLHFSSRILRISRPKAKKSTLCYQIFLPFNEEIRDYLRSNPELFVV